MKDKLLTIFKTVFESDSITEEVSQENYPNWDSLKHLGLIVEIEKEFSISLEPEDIVKIKSFNDAYEFIK